MKSFVVILLVMLAMSAPSQSVKRIDQYPNRSAIDPNDIFLIEDNLSQAYWTQTRSNLNFQFVNQDANFWSGPTNNIDMNVATHNNADLYYLARTPMQISGIINKSASGVQTVTLTIANVGTTNITLILPTEMMTREGSRSYTITNQQDFVISIRYHPLLNHTNSVSCVNQ